MGLSDHEARLGGTLIRLLFISDGVQAATGFGTAARNILPRLSEAGFSIDALSIYHYGAEQSGTGYSTAFPVSPGDSMGFSQIPRLLRRGPAVVVLMHEMVYCRQWATRIRVAGWPGPIVGYFPVYGPTLAPEERSALRLMDARAALSHYGARVVESHGFPCAAVHLGVDPGRFRPAHPAVWRRLRRELGWENRFVVVYLARNRWNKQQPKLLAAAGILRERGVDDMLFYLHCVPSAGSLHWVPGMGAVAQEYDLFALRRELGLEDIVLFPGDLTDQTAGIPEELLIQRLQAADCAAHVAHGEGFGLPLIEALACGLPVLHTADGRVMSEVVGRSGWGVKARGELTDSFMNRFSDVTPKQWAEAILGLRRLMESPSERRVVRRRARRRALGFCWDRTTERLEGVIRRAMEGDGSWRRG